MQDISHRMTLGFLQLGESVLATSTAGQARLLRSADNPSRMLLLERICARRSRNVHRGDCCGAGLPHNWVVSERTIFASMG